MSNPVHYRKFLNSLDDGGTAYVAFSIEYNKRGYVSAEFSVRDCYKEATLDFYVDKLVRKGKINTENAIAKINTLRNAIDEFEKAFLSALDERDTKIKSKRKRKR